MKKIYVVLICVCNALLVKATVINVPAMYSSIQTAINAAVNGDTIVVASGTYFENINFRGKKILLTSNFYLAKDTTYISSTIINGSTPSNPDTASCVIFNSGEDSTSILQGFTLTGGAGTKWTDIHGAGVYREGGGVLMDLSSPTVCYNFIVNNKAINVSAVTSAGGGGIRIGDGKPYILNNIIANNQGKYGPGIVLNYTGATIKNNIIANNSGATSYTGGGGIWIYSNHTMGYAKLIENNTIINNVSSVSTGGVSVQSATNVIIHNNIIWGNLPHGAQLNVSSAVPVVTYNDIQNAYAGIGNINVDPLLEVCDLLNASSPCIDKGDSLPAYNDVVATASLAALPSMGTVRNDMGAYGGPKAFMLACPSELTGIKQQTNLNTTLTIYPNPATNYVQINSESKEPTQLMVFDILGAERLQTTMQQGKTTIDITSLPAGVYFIKTNKGIQKFIKG